MLSSRRIQTPVGVLDELLVQVSAPLSTEDVCPSSSYLVVV
jgi:hypothetical protein